MKSKGTDGFLQVSVAVGRGLLGHYIGHNSNISKISAHGAGQNK